jgi:signal transduction histidine kinase
MPHGLSPVVIASAVAELVGFSFAAAVLLGLHGSFPRPHLRAWSRAFAAAALAVLAGMAYAALHPVPAPARMAYTFGVVLLLLAQAGLSAEGARSLSGRPVAPRLHRSAVAAALLLALAAAAGSAPGWPRTLLRFAVPQAAVAGGMLLAAAAAWRSRGQRSATGPALMAGSLFLLGLEGVHDAAMHLLSLLGRPLAGYAVYHGFLDLALLGAFGLGAVVSQLEEERALLAAAEEKMKRDLAERLAVEEELRRARAMESLGALVGGVAHETRNPLFAISALADALQNGPPGRDVTPHVSQLKSQVQRLSRLMSDLLDYGRPAELRRETLCVTDVVTRAAASLASEAAQRDVRVVVETEPGLPVVEADAARLEQVFENLIANAIQHAPVGTVVRVRAGVSSPGSGAALDCTVEDSGPGVPDEERTRVFEPFFSRRKGGTGLGLAIVQRAVEAHGGTVAAGAGPDGGARFSVRLPLATP